MLFSKASFLALLSLAAGLARALPEAVPAAVPEGVSAVTEERSPALLPGHDHVLNARDSDCCGLFICDGRDFTGNCYWACYPYSERIEPDEYFQHHIGSWGPDEGCGCYSYTFEDDCCGSCSEHPGCSLSAPYKNNIQYFYCNPA